VKAQEFRQMDDAALREEVEKRRQELLNLRCQVALGEEMRPHQIRTLRRDIARMLTVLREQTNAAKGAEA
jgi:large subunit ribosomal protein L29